MYPYSLSTRFPRTSNFVSSKFRVQSAPRLCYINTFSSVLRVRRRCDFCHLTLEASSICQWSVQTSVCVCVQKDKQWFRETKPNYGYCPYTAHVWPCETEIWITTVFNVCSCRFTWLIFALIFTKKCECYVFKIPLKFKVTNLRLSCRSEIQQIKDVSKNLIYAIWNMDLETHINYAQLSYCTNP